jgi:hypothetical protein
MKKFEIKKFYSTSISIMESSGTTPGVVSSFGNGKHSTVEFTFKSFCKVMKNLSNLTWFLSGFINNSQTLCVVKGLKKKLKNLKKKRFLKSFQVFGEF